jgi:hypothetical protein
VLIRDLDGLEEAKRWVAMPTSSGQA